MPEESNCKMEMHFSSQTFRFHSMATWLLVPRAIMDSSEKKASWQSCSPDGSQAADRRGPGRECHSKSLYW